jgi:hypothetical protein
MNAKKPSLYWVVFAAIILAIIGLLAVIVIEI